MSNQLPSMQTRESTLTTDNQRGVNHEQLELEKHLINLKLANNHNPDFSFLRPTLILLLGGTGQLIGIHLKAVLTARFGKTWQEKTRILAFDTTEEPFTVQLNDNLIQLESGAEFFHIGNVPIANIQKNLNQHEAIQNRLGPIMNTLPAGILRGGAKQMRPLGQLAFLWHFPTIEKQIRKALWHLASRELDGNDVNTNQQGINVFICSSLVGGTGAGIFLDTAYLVRTLFADLGSQSDFCHITGIGVLPQAFQGIQGPNIYPNAGASLQELNHAMVNGGFHTNYPNGRTVNIRETPFNLFYVIDGVDEQGRTWQNVTTVTSMIAEGITLQMASQLGRKGDNAFDNMDEILIGRTSEGEGTFLASFGIGTIEFPAKTVIDLCSQRLLAEQIEQIWLKPSQSQAIKAEVKNKTQPLSAGQLSHLLLRDPNHDGTLGFDLRQPTWLLEKPHNIITTETVRYIREFGHVRVNEGILAQLQQNSLHVSQQQKEQWSKMVESALFSSNQSLIVLLDLLSETRTQLTLWIGYARRNLSEISETEGQLTLALNQLESNIGQATASLWLGRQKRVQEAVSRYFQSAEERFEAQFQSGQLRAQLRVWGELSDHLGQLARMVETLKDRLEAIREELKATFRETQSSLSGGGVSHVSLADETYVNTLYAEYKPTHVNIFAITPSLSHPFVLIQMTNRQLKETMLYTVAKYFQPIRNLTVEQVIDAHSDEMTYRARRQQLFNLATPAWNINRARLTEGGANLVRLEVMGVPDQTDTLFAEEEMLVSTQDPYRLVALVVVAGIPQTALKQYDQYRQELERVRNLRPMYILPHFVAHANRSKLAFALALVFKYITPQGTYFYYHSSDKLQESLKLGNGLANAVKYLGTQEVIVHEIMHRVETQIEYMGLQQTIETLTNYYTNVPNGKTDFDDLTRKLKRFVRDYTNQLRQISNLVQ